MLRVEVGALGAHQVKNIRGVVGQARMCKAPVWVDVGISAPAGLLTFFFFEMDTVHVFFVVVGSLVSLISRTGCFQPGAGVSWL